MTACCRATLNYAPATPSGGPVAIEVEIRDGRRAALPDWTVCGFELRAHASVVRDWDDDAEIASVHHPEVETLARELTGCDHAIVSNHIKRNPDQAKRHQDLAPITFVHSDFAASYADFYRKGLRNGGEKAVAGLARHGLTPDDVDAARRLVVLQFWRNLGPPKMDLPIAFCDARTVSPDHARAFLITDYAGGGGAFEALGVVPPADPASHAWYTFPDMGPGDVVAFRTYDTDLVAAGATFFTPHSAFRDPDVELGRPARSSIELRATCLFT
jgi:hypothetical protein